MVALPDGGAWSNTVLTSWPMVKVRGGRISGTLGGHTPVTFFPKAMVPPTNSSQKGALKFPAI